MDKNIELAELRVRMITAARDILALIRSRLFIDFRFMDSAVARLDIENDDMVKTLSTRGNILYYNAKHVIETYKDEPTRMNREYLHSVMHCVFRHQFVSPKIDRAKWNLACDVAVENILTEMGSKDLNCKGEQYQEDFLNKLKKDNASITAERVYKYLNDNKYSDDEVKKISELFERDNHVTWWPDNDSKDEESTDGNGKSAEDKMKELRELQKEWEDISSMLNVDLETLSREKGGIKALIQNLKEVNRQKYDYSEFLKKFAIMGEDLMINDDEFDYIYYTYGLERYGNMPLVEPLEYRETKKICDFVIAIDTSGSCQGEIVQKFLEKTYNIMMQQENFFKKINIRIIQCDDKIEDEIKIESKDDFDTYMKFMQIKGFGGTDFRPVFERVDELVEKKEFKKLKGVIYFTDGYGKYPEKKPNYDTAFIFLGYDAERPQPPSWAMRIVLDEEQITQK
ncbi:MAG: VWA-like domain-containing protein [Clostridia bacterium]|jgi:predicted metal-dependent peptidase|nr:VWA-like domain-containing protein [Clostridia bacterium]MCI2000087.1 VWA-like domain-containing protein [Clostridia bacterium]MCI2014379.1 VWA-like domain-containing protein [Clostridia bacterium]